MKANAWALVSLGVVACSEPAPKESGAPDAGLTAEPSLPLAESAPEVGGSPLRRLTNFEYRNTLVDLIGDEELVAELTAELLNEAESGGFRNDASTLTVTPLLAQTYLNVAVGAAAVVPDVDGLVPCDVDDVEVADMGACAEQFVRDFGRQVFRRPLSELEVSGFADLYTQAGNETGSFRAAIEWVSAGLLSSLPFLFRVEAPPAVAAGASERVTAFELASRLSYLLWQSQPDEVLLDAAAAGELTSESQVADQVRRMLRDARALRVVEFFEQWLDIDLLAELLRDETVYPEVPDKLPELLRAESRAFVLNLLSNEGTFAELIAADYTFANRQLAEHYGLETVPEGLTFERVPAPGRYGILTQGMLVAHDREDRTSIVRRGVKIRTDLLCMPPPPPPENADLTLPAPDGSLSQRQRLEQHRAIPECRACHAVIDPLGVVFEAFDATGRPRKQDELGQDVDSHAVVEGAGDLDGEYASAGEFADALAESSAARDCLTEKAFQFFYGRRLTVADAPTLAALGERFAENDYRLVDLIVALTTTDQFLYKSRGAEL